MAFVFEAERKGIISPEKVSSAGPGQYLSQSASKQEQSYAPFLSTTTRGFAKKTKELGPGPGAYQPQLSIGNLSNTNKAFHSTLNPEKEDLHTHTFTTSFKSTTKRFEHQINVEQPGPGTYTAKSAFEKAASVSTPSLSVKSTPGFDIKKLISENRPKVPSIPSNTHSYGYSELDTGKVSLNKNPLLEIQQYVGPGYYDHKNPIENETNKGTTWHKSGVKRFETSENKQPTRLIGPGAYDVLNFDGAAPLYKGKQSSGFASTTGRMNIANGKQELLNSKSLQKASPVNDFELGTLDANLMLDDKLARLQDGTTPGPGSYYNASTSSSIKATYKPAQYQFFGSGTERFKMDPAATVNVGPGDYSQHEGKKKKKSSAPFLTKDPKMKPLPPSELGPGVYSDKPTIVDRVEDKAKKGYLGSFGTTELRFKPEKIPAEPVKPSIMISHQEINQPKVEPPERTNKKPSHFFTSTTVRKVVNDQVAAVPPPGSYETNYYDLSKKINDAEGIYYYSKKAPFTSSEARFKWDEGGNRKSQDVNSNVDEHLLKKTMRTFKPAVKPQQSSVFSSTTLRAASCLPRDGKPGPGTYHNPRFTSTWVKKSYNTKFIEDN